MGKRFSRLTGTDFAAMAFAAARSLELNVSRVNALNVFPVPDGDTGTNMNLTMTSGVEELRKRQTDHIGQAAEALSKGLLMGARGNSGVILSQLFRGFAKSVQTFAEINVHQFAAALQQGVDTAYKAVVKPVEGTVLTVAKDAAKYAVQNARRADDDIRSLMDDTLAAAKQSLARTPDLLPVLKQVGVVDAGGQGLVFIYEGFVAALAGETAGMSALERVTTPAQQSFSAAAHMSYARNAQSQLATEDIEFGYCTEFMIKLVPGKVKGLAFDESAFRKELSKHGDSLLVVSDDELVKVHIHAEYPGAVMNEAMKFGDLTKIKIENMREQHTHLLHEGEEGYGQFMTGMMATNASIAAAARPAASMKPATKRNGFVAVAAGNGIERIFASLGADGIISGGQTMNPSTEDIVKAVGNIQAERVYVLPNNSNIVMAARQAVGLVEDKQLIVIPTKTIPQGIAAALAFQSDAENADTNTAAMERALNQVKSGQVTNAVRDTSIDGVEIKEGDFLGICDGSIVASFPELSQTCRKLLDSMMADGGEVVTILTGEDAIKEETDAIVASLREAYPDAEIEIHDGGQPVYTYLFSVE